MDYNNYMALYDTECVSWSIWQQCQADEIGSDVGMVYKYSCQCLELYPVRY